MSVRTHPSGMSFRFPFFFTLFSISLFSFLFLSSQQNSYFSQKMKTAYTDGFFSVGAEHGFLPIHDPLEVLPERYASLQQLMDDMPINLPSGEGGILSREGEIVEAVKTRLEDFSEAVKTETDTFIIHALYRAYSFLASAYLLESAHWDFTRTGKPGKARQSLPAAIAVPFCWVADKLQVYPFLEYSYAYSLGK